MVINEYSNPDDIEAANTLEYCCCRGDVAIGFKNAFSVSVPMHVQACVPRRTLEREERMHKTHHFLDVYEQPSIGAHARRQVPRTTRNASCKLYERHARTYRSTLHPEVSVVHVLELVQAPDLCVQDGERGAGEAKRPSREQARDSNNGNNGESAMR